MFIDKENKGENSSWKIWREVHFFWIFYLKEFFSYLP
jgi:hypothetical protein